MTISLMLQNNIIELVEQLQNLPAWKGQLEALGKLMLRVWKKKGKVLIAGNGGSAADAMHFSEELTVRFKKNRKALASIALCDPTAITCSGNDFGYDTIFSRQVEALGNKGDLLIVLSTSGNSPNVIKAVDKAEEQEMYTCGFSGNGGGKLFGKCDIGIFIPSNSTARIQECHKVLFHTLCEWIDDQVP